MFAFAANVGGAVFAAVGAVLAIGLSVTVCAVFWKVIFWLGELLYGKGNFHI